MREGTGIGRLAGKPWLAPALLVVAIVVWAVVFGFYRSQLGFIGDDWTFITMRMNGGIDAYMAPHNSNIVVLFVAMFRALLEVFGLTHPFGLHVFAMVAYIAVAVALFVYLRRLVGDALSLLSAVVILFLGAGADSLLTIFQACFSISIATGIAALLALERDRWKWDLVACGLLLVSVFTVTLGLAFLAAAGMKLLLSRKAIRRSHVVLVPLVLFIAWYLGWGREDATTTSLDILIDTPGFIFDAFGYSLTVLTGTFKLEGWFGDRLPTVFAVVALGSIILRCWRRRHIPPELLVALAAGIAFWGLSGLSQLPELLGLRNFDMNRYQLPNAVFALMILAGGFAGARPKAGWKFALAAVAVAAIWVNMVTLADVNRSYAVPNSNQARASLTALDLLGPGQVDPSSRVTLFGLGPLTVDAGTYFALKDRLGSGGWDPSEIEDQSGDARVSVDAALRLVRPYVVEKQEARPPGPCRVLEPGAGGETAAVPLIRELYFRSGGKGVLKTGRFTGDEPAGIAYFGGYWVRVVPPGDGIMPPWRINGQSTEPVRVCVAGGG